MPTTTRRGDWINFGTEPRVRMLDRAPLQWRLDYDLTRCHVAASTMGGHTAISQRVVRDIEDPDDPSSVGPKPPGGGAHDDDRMNEPATIHLFRADGSHVTTIEEDCQVHFMCFNELNDDLIVVLESGEVRFYTMSGKKAALDRSCGKPFMCTTTCAGVAIVNADMDLVVFQLELPRRGGIGGSSLGNRGGDSDASSVGGGLARYDCYAGNVGMKLGPDSPSCLLAIPRQFSPSGDVLRVIVAPPQADEHDVTGVYAFQSLPRLSQNLDNEGRYKIDAEKVDPPGLCEGGAITRMALSPDGQRVATLSMSGAIHITTPEFKSYQRVASTETLEPPAQFLWCGNRVIVYLFLTSQFPDDDYATTLSLFCIDEPGLRPGSATRAEPESTTDVPDDLYLAQEPDGLRMLSALEPNRHRMVQVIPPHAIRLYHRSSAAPAAQLVHAYDMFEDGDPASVKALRTLFGGKDQGTEQLHAAIVDCVQTASFEEDPILQQRLLRIASYGKTFCAVFDTAEFTAACRRIRAWNAVRAVGGVGMLCTMPQFIVMEQTGRLLKRLIHLGEFALANEIAVWLNLSTRNEVLEAWAVAKIDGMLARPPPEADRSGEGRLDSTIANVVLSKVRGCPGLQYTAIARHASRAGRDFLFRMLLEEEPSAEKHITELLRQRDYNAALTKAVQFIDPDLIYSCLIQIAGLDSSSFDRIAAGAVGQKRDRMAQDMWLIVVRHLKLDQRRQLTWLAEHPVVVVQQALTQYFVNLRRVHRNPDDVAYVLAHDPDDILEQTVRDNADMIRAVMQTGSASAGGGGLAGGGGTSKSGLPTSAADIRSSISRIVPGAGGAGSSSAANAAAAHATMEAMGELTAALKKQALLAQEQKSLISRLQPGDRNYMRRSMFIGATIARTLELCYQFKFPDKTIEDLVKKFHVPEKVACWCRLKGLVAANDIERIVEMGRSRGKLAIGHAPIVTELINLGQRAAAVDFIPKIPNLVDRLELWVQCGDWRGATLDCLRSKEPGLVDQLKDRARGNSEAISIIDSTAASGR